MSTIKHCPSFIFTNTVDAATGAGFLFLTLPQVGWQRKGRVVIISHFCLSEAGWGLGQPEGVPGQLLPLMGLLARPQGRVYSSHAIGRLCSSPEQLQPGPLMTTEQRCLSTAP